MSRSYCKPIRSFEQEYKNELNWKHKGITACDLWWEYRFVDIDQSRWKYYTKKHTNHYNSMRFPRYYRKEVNNLRRNHDKRELYKEINLNDHEGLYSRWSCKDADPWWFW